MDTITMLRQDSKRERTQKYGNLNKTRERQNEVNVFTT